jgi:hypothetical protein
LSSNLQKSKNTANNNIIFESVLYMLKFTLIIILEVQKKKLVHWKISCSRCDKNDTAVKIAQHIACSYIYGCCKFSLRSIFTAALNIASSYVIRMVVISPTYYSCNNCPLSNHFVKKIVLSVNYTSRYF